MVLIMDDLRFRKIFNQGITKDISAKKLSKLEKLQSLVAKCCKIRKSIALRSWQICIHLYYVPKLVTKLVTNSRT